MGSLSCTQHTFLALFLSDIPCTAAFILVGISLDTSPTGHARLTLTGQWTDARNK